MRQIFITLSVSILGQHLVNWRGRVFTEDEKNGFDLFSILDVPCMISVTHNVKGEKTYANVSGIMGAPKGTAIPDRETPLVGYSPQDPARAADFDKMPEWLQKKCQAGHRMADSPTEYANQMPPPAGAPGSDDFDDIPFVFVLPTLLGTAMAAQRQRKSSPRRPGTNRINVHQLDP